MSSLEPFILRIKPAMDSFLHQTNKENLNRLEVELAQFNWMHMKIFNIQILVPLVLKLDELGNSNQDLRTGCLQCITLVTSKIYLKELTALRTMLVVILKQVRECDKAAMKPNLSEEIKLATVQSISECFMRSTTDVLEQFYCKESSTILGQILLTLVELIENEKYKKLVLASLECLMSVFYIHDEADRMDVVLRNQVADVLFIFLPKIVTVLYRIALADDKIGETIKINSVKALGRILCVVYEETTEDVAQIKYDANAFKRLLSLNQAQLPNSNSENDILGINKDRQQLEIRMNQMQCDGRTSQWTEASSKKLRVVFSEMSILRSQTSTKIRKEYANFCCLLIQNCAHNLKENFVYMLEAVVALTEDEDNHIKDMCSTCLNNLQTTYSIANFFDENAEILLDEHLTKLPRIIQRCDADEQYTEFLFIKGFFKSISCHNLQLLLSVPHNLEMFCMCLLSALDLNINSNLLLEEYSLRNLNIARDYTDASKLPWRSFKYIASERCVKCLEVICITLGRIPVLDKIIMDHLLEMQQKQYPATNEILLIMLWLSTAKTKDNTFKYTHLDMVKQLLNELLDEKHWHLALEPERATKHQSKQPTDWTIDRTPGLYKSAIEIRMQDCDSDDETEDLQHTCIVKIADAEFNVLHTCLVLDCLGHCALYLGERFDAFVFQSLHKVLLKLGSSNSMVYKAANFTIHCVQKALRFNNVSQLIETHMDYITYHLNTLLKRTPDSQSAVDILAIVLQFSSRNALPHLESIFQTIYEECSKAYQTQNVLSYLKVFNAFLNHITSWLHCCDLEILESQSMQTDHAYNALEAQSDLLASWLELLNSKKILTEENSHNNPTNELPSVCMDQGVTHIEENTKKLLPHHVEVIKSILQQVIKFINSTDERLQVLSLECLTCGLPLLAKYEDELLPLVHKIWSPLMEKFRQRNVLVLNRCFSLFGVLTTHAKDFITKRSLDDVIPYLKEFLQKSSLNSSEEILSAQTQQFKLQVKLLNDFPNVVICLDLDGKHFNEIAEIVAIYLSQEQPKDLQSLAIDFFKTLRFYNGPLIYLVIVKKSHLKLYKDNVRTILLEFGVK